MLKKEAAFKKAASLSTYFICQLGVRPPSNLGKSIHADVETLRRLKAASTVNVYCQNCSFLVRWQAYHADGLFRPAWAHR